MSIFSQVSLLKKQYARLMAQSDLRDICHTLGGGFSPIGVSGLSSVHKSLTAAALYEYLCSECGEKEAPMLIICESEAAAKRICDDINVLTGGENALLYPAKDITLTRVESVSREYEYQRLGVLSAMLCGSCRFVCTSAEAALQATLPPDKLKTATLILSVGSSVNTAELADRLVSSGYTRCSEVKAPSQFAVRGAIIDIFPVGQNMPVRMELWGDDIDTIACFDPETQRRTDPVDEIAVPPAREVLFSSGNELAEKIRRLGRSLRSKRADIIREKLERDAEKAEDGLTLSNIDKYIPLAYGEQYLIFDYLQEGSVTVFSEYRGCAEAAKAAAKQMYEDMQLLYDEGELCKGLEGYLTEFENVTEYACRHRCLVLDSFMRTNSELSFKRLISLTAFQTSTWGGEMRQLAEDIRSYFGRGYAVILLAGSEKTLPVISQDLAEEGIPCDILTENAVPANGRVLLTTGCLSSGYDYPAVKTALITQAKAMAAKRKHKKASGQSEIRSLSDISCGDLVVHVLHGIGRFEGIRKLELEGVTKDYITIKYAGTDVLYVPVTQMDLISRYIGPGGDNGVKLNKLSSNDWQKTRAKVRKAVKDMAEELIALYAKRSQTKGFAFSPDSDWQADFESRFDYTETDDQLRCIEEIKRDMEKPVPMDRLLCGDVGFGKTEVAFRAACKCMLDGKQCALLVPTTVLAWQHFQSALKRFEHFPVKIELLSRFRTRQQQLEILRQLKAGAVDMVIGTHRLVQKDVEFKDLGLAIIDEEQRFGVAHKERFKKTFAGVDVLMLSATPIPRTLNMAMSGIRDMSVIEEPPVDRYPVQTYVIEHDVGIIVQAIHKELRRGGQIYYIHNRIDSIDLCRAKLQELIPDARIAVAHGQIDEEALSDIWQQLITHEIDILICTTIIETGVDVPNVNTLIIEDADNMGLSQLYQLRGRVGRSNRRAFAYFTFRRDKCLSEVAAQRLDAIREFTQFGSGFKIAMRDLEIRGAGNILGGQQHGHMEAVGYDMYIRMLNEALAEETGQLPPPKPEDCLIDLQIEAHIPDNYIEDLTSRLEAYRRIAGIETKADSEDVIDEFIDRYGDPPKSIMGLITVSLVRSMASAAGVNEITQKGGKIVIMIRSMCIKQLQALAGVYDDRVTVSSGETGAIIAIKPRKSDKIIDILKKSVELLYDNRENAEE